MRMCSEMLRTYLIAVKDYVKIIYKMITQSKVKKHILIKREKLNQSVAEH